MINLSFSRGYGTSQRDNILWRCLLGWTNRTCERIIVGFIVPYSARSTSSGVRVARLTSYTRNSIFTILASFGTRQTQNRITDRIKWSDAFSTVGHTTTHILVSVMALSTDSWGLTGVANVRALATSHWVLAELDIAETADITVSSSISMLTGETDHIWRTACAFRWTIFTTGRPMESILTYSTLSIRVTRQTIFRAFRFMFTCSLSWIYTESWFQRISLFTLYTRRSRRTFFTGRWTIFALETLIIRINCTAVAVDIYFAVLGSGLKKILTVGWEVDLPTISKQRDLKYDIVLRWSKVNHHCFLIPLTEGNRVVVRGPIQG